MAAATTRKHKRSNFRATFGVSLSLSLTFCHATDCSSSCRGAVSSFRLLDSEEMATLCELEAN